MILYHGTSEIVARKALEVGLLPRGSRASRWKVPSGADRVYLTDAYAPYFAANAVDKEDGPARWAIIEVDTAQLDSGMLVPDEDWLEQITRNAGSYPWTPTGTMRQRTRWFKTRIKKFRDAWSESLRGMGNCAYLGAIPPTAITRVSLFDPHSNPWVMMRSLDPTITSLNYQIVGHSYRALTRWFFEEVTPAEVDPFNAKRREMNEATIAVFGGENYDASISEELAKRDGLEILYGNHHRKVTSYAQSSEGQPRSADEREIGNHSS